MVQSLICGDEFMNDNKKKKRILIIVIAVFGVICLCSAGYLIGKEVGIFGEVNPQVLENWAVTVPCAACELDLEMLLSE